MQSRVQAAKSSSVESQPNNVQKQPVIGVKQDSFNASSCSEQTSEWSELIQTGFSHGIETGVNSYEYGFRLHTSLNLIQAMTNLRP